MSSRLLVYKKSGVGIFFGLLFPVAAALRVAVARKPRSGVVEPRSSLRAFGPTTNKILTLIHDLERKTLFRAYTLAGLTLFCVAGQPS